MRHRSKTNLSQAPMTNLIQDPAPSRHPRLVHRAAIAWCTAPFLAAIILYVRKLHLSLDGDYHGWSSANCFTMARAFNALGALHMRFVPFQNNLPVGSDPDVYLHWPPLYPLVLAGFLRIFGDTPAAGRILELLIVLVTTPVVMLIARRLFSPHVALLSGFFYLTCRATFQGASAIVQQPLAMLFASASVLFFLLAVRAAPNTAPRIADAKDEPAHGIFSLLGVFCVVLTILTAWDPVFIPFGLLAGSVFLRHRAGIRLSIIYIGAAAIAFAGVQTDYILSYPAMFKNQLATIAYRAGLHFDANSSIHLHSIADSANYAAHYSIFWLIEHICDNIYDFVGPFALLASCIVLAIWLQAARLRERHPAPSTVLLLFGLGLPWIVWTLAMPNYMAIHSFTLVLAAPFVAISSAFVLDAIWDFLSVNPQRKPFLWIMVGIFPLLILYPLIMGIGNAHMLEGAPQFSDLSAVVEHNTPLDAIVISPCESFVPVYYSHRHSIRGIESDRLLQSVIGQARTDFPGDPLFLAIEDADRKDLPVALSHLKPLAQQGDSTVYSLSDSNTR